MLWAALKHGHLKADHHYLHAAKHIYMEYIEAVYLSVIGCHHCEALPAWQLNCEHVESLQATCLRSLLCLGGFLHLSYWIRQDRMRSPRTRCSLMWQ